MSVIRYPALYEVHKKEMGSLQFGLSRPQEETVASRDPARPPRIVTHPGAIYLEAASPLPGGDGDRMDWANKVTVKLSASDLSEIICAIRFKEFPPTDKPLVYHSYQGVATMVDVRPGEQPGTFRWHVLRRGGGKPERRVGLYLSRAETYLLLTLFDHALPVLFGWSEGSVPQVLLDARRAAQAATPQGVSAAQPIRDSRAGRG